MKPLLFLVMLLSARAGYSQQAQPIVLGETFTIQSRVLNEPRRINVWVPPVYTDSPNVKLPVLYMPDGGLDEDFVHVMGTMQIGILNQTMRPFILVGIPNTQRRRDLTGPTNDPQDKKIAPVVSGSANFRAFIRNELMPEINRRYRTTSERAVMGESLAGLFVVETMFVEPDLFDEYLAFDPSLWWNRNALVNDAVSQLPKLNKKPIKLFLANSDEPVIAKQTRRLAAMLKKKAPSNLTWYYQPLPEETHGTIYEPASILAVRKVLK